MADPEDVPAEARRPAPPRRRTAEPTAAEAAPPARRERREPAPADGVAPAAEPIRTRRPRPTAEPVPVPADPGAPSAAVDADRAKSAAVPAEAGAAPAATTPRPRRRTAAAAITADTATAAPDRLAAPSRSRAKRAEAPAAPDAPAERSGTAARVDGPPGDAPPGPTAAASPTSASPTTASPGAVARTDRVAAFAARLAAAADALRLTARPAGVAAARLLSRSAVATAGLAGRAAVAGAAGARSAAAAVAARTGAPRTGDGRPAAVGSGLWTRLGFGAGAGLLVAFLVVMVWREQTTPSPSAPPAVEPARSAGAGVALAVGERGQIGGRLDVSLAALAADGSTATIVPVGGDPLTLQLGTSVEVPFGSRVCAVVLTGVSEGRAVVSGNCVGTVPPAPGEISAPVERLVRGGDRALFAGGRLEVAVSMVSPAGGTLRAGLAGGPVETLEQGVPAVVHVGGDSCSVAFLGTVGAAARLSAACSGETGRRLVAEAAVEATFAPHRRTAVPTDRTATFLGGLLDVYVGPSAPRGDAVRLAIDGGVMTAVPVGGVEVVDVAGTLCAVAVLAVRPDGADIGAACSGRLAGPASLSGRDGAAAAVRALVEPGARTMLLDERVRVVLSMISPDGEAVRWSINEAGLVTTAIGGTAEFRVGDGRCGLTALRPEAGGVRVRAVCDAGAMAATLARAAGEEIAEIRPGAAARLLGGKVRVALSMIAPDGEAVRVAVNGGDLATVERASPSSFAFGAGACTVEYVGTAASGAARIRAACDGAALASDVLVPGATERVALAPGRDARLLGGRLALRLSMVTPDGEAIRIAANGGDLVTAERDRPLRFASGGGACELVFRGRDGDRATVAAACDDAALAGPAFVPVRTERVDLAVARPVTAQAGRLPLALNMVAPDRRALRIAVAEAGLGTLERGRPLTVPVGRGACQVAFVGANGTGATVDTACDAGAFERAPVPADVERRVELGYGRPVSLFDGRTALALSMIAPRRDAARIAVDDVLRTLDVGEPSPLRVEDRDCALVLERIGDDDRLALRVGCGAGLRGVVAAAPIPPETRRIAPGETAAFFAGTVALRLEMISPSRTGLRVSIDGAKVASLDRGEPRAVDVGGRRCHLDYRGTDRSGPTETAIVEGRCE